MRVCVTGSSGYIGNKLIAALRERRLADEIVGIDILEPRAAENMDAFYRRDVREPAGDILRKHRIDTVVHAAFILPPIHNTARMEDVNVNGTRVVFDEALANGVRRILYTSSATAYGFHPDNDRPLTEESDLRGNDDFTYSKTKRIIEAMIAAYRRERPDAVITVLRPSFVVGPGFDNPLAWHLNKRVVILPSRTEPMQFVHEDDLLEIMCMMLARGEGGDWDVGADGTVPLQDMVGMLGNRMLGLPAGLMAVLNTIAWTCRLSFLSAFPTPALNMVLYPWVVSGEKLRRITGYSYRYTSREAFEDYAAHVRGLRAVSGRRAGRAARC